MQLEFLCFLLDLLQLPYLRDLRLQELLPHSYFVQPSTFRTRVFNRPLSTTRRTRALALILALCSPDNFGTSFQGPCDHRRIGFWYPRLDYLCAHYLQHPRHSNTVFETYCLPCQKPFYAIVFYRKLVGPGVAKDILR